MHVSDALISPPVALTTGICAISLIAVASKKVKESRRPDIIPLMGIMGAFIFACQMINFSIPGTGSSGHLIGGIFLSAILGPWCGFIALSSIIIVQCLFFADGGLMALGCNIINMAATTCLFAFPLIYKPIVKGSINPARIITGSIIASIVALQVGAFLVTVEAEFSQITALPFSTFIKFMLPIHLAIGLTEGIITGALIVFVAKMRPEILSATENNISKKDRKQLNPTMWIFIGLTVVLAAGFTVFASELPDGLEWSIAQTSGIEEMDSEVPATAFMPDYNSSFSGLIGSVIVIALIWCVSSIIFARIRKTAKANES